MASGGGHFKSLVEAQELLLAGTQGHQARRLALHLQAQGRDVKGRHVDEVFHVELHGPKAGGVGQQSAHGFPLAVSVIPSGIV